MPVTTIHQFLPVYPWNPNHRKLILGTIHPHNVAEFLIQYFYGNVGSFWKIIREALALPDYYLANLQSITDFLDRYGIWVSDMVQQCDREHEGVTRDCDLYNLVLNTESIREALVNSNIDTIFSLRLLERIMRQSCSRMRLE